MALYKFPKRPEDMRILLSNDDGVRAPGMKVLERIARKLTKDVWIVAPENEQSGAGHSLTFRMPLFISRLAPRRYSVAGTPTDAVLLGIQEVMKDRPPDLVLSGVNRGENMGDHITYSGTVSAAMEGALLGIPSVALSQQLTDWRRVHWPTAEKWGPEVLRKLISVSWRTRTLMNVNFPDLPPDQVKGTVVTTQGERVMGGGIVEARHPRGGRYYWLGPLSLDVKARKGTDLEAAARGYVTVTPIALDLTDRRGMAPLRKVFPDAAKAK